MTPRTSHLVGPLLRYASERGETLDPARFGLDAQAFDRDESAIADAQLGRLFDEVAERLDEPNLGLALPGVLRFQRYALPELAARASATLRESMQQWTRYAPLLHPAVVFELQEAEGRAYYRHRTLGHPRGLSRHLNEFALAASVFWGRETSRLGPRVLEVHFAHARPRSLDRLREFFQTGELSFGAAANLLVLDSRSLDSPQRTADARLLATVESIARGNLEQRARDPGGLPAQVAARVSLQLEQGDLQIRRLARELHMSVRTLQRRLADENTSFASILDDVRSQLARELVASDMPLAEIAARLGFAELASFGRAFKRWTGQSPGSYRSGSTLD